MDGMQQDELAEIDLTEAEIDAMMAEGEPVEVTGPFDPVRRVRFELVGAARTPTVGGSSPPTERFWRPVPLPIAARPTSAGSCPH